MIIGPLIATQERLRLVDMLQLPSEPMNLLYRPRGRQITLAQGAVALLRVFRLELWLAYLFAMDFVRKCFFNYTTLPSLINWPGQYVFLLYQKQKKGIR